MAEYIVDSLSDLVDGNHGAGELTLREALALANAAPGMDRIGFAAPLAGATIRLTQGPLEITDDLVLDGDIDGDGQADITLSGDANGDDATMLDGFGNTVTDATGNTASADNSAVLRLTGAAATLHGLVITGGVAGAGIEGGGISVDAGSSLALTASSLSGNRAGGNGGGIAAEGAVTLDGSLIEGNVSQRRGGGIATDATLVVTGSTIAGNSALFDGGGVFAMPGATLTLGNVTVSGNAAYRGAGLLSYGTLTAINTTVAHNAAGNYGGGLFNRGSAELFHATVTGNSGTYGGGIYNAAASLTLTNSLVTGNTASGYGPEIAFGAVTNRNSIIGGAAASIFAALDPTTGGGALAENGGPVATVALADDIRNPARDGGTRALLPADALDLDGDGLVSEFLPVDARGAGYLRRQSARPDLGAFELGPVPVRIEITEIMADADAAGSDWQWIEIMNTGSMTADLTGWVLDDDDGAPFGAANISAGSVESGAVAVLYNADAITPAGFAAAWGSDIPLIAVSGWPALTPGQGMPETVSLWDSFASYSGDESAHANAVATVSFASGGDFPDLATGSSIHRRDLTDPSLAGAAWALSQAGTDGAIAADGTVTGSGTDAGSPGTVALPAFIVDHEAGAPRETAEDQPLALSGLGFDRFLASGSAPVMLTAIATQGTVDIGDAGASAVMTLADLDALAAAGGIVYTPDADFSGADTILLTLDEAAPGGLAPETLAISVTVTPVDDPPVAFADEAPAIGAFTGTASALAIFPLADNGNGADLDADGDPVTIASVTQPGIGTVSLNGDRVDFSLPANALPALPFGARASTSFTYTLDGGAVAKVNVPIISGGDIVPLGATGPTGTGTAGSDVILLSEEDETWSGGEGADILLGNLGNDILRGDGGDDLLFGEAGNDTLEGGAGDDVLAGGRGADSLNGGAGRDTASYAGAVAGVRVDLLGALANLGEAAGDSFAGIEIHEGSGFDDDLRGSAGIETLLGGDGNDLLVGRGSVDVLEGGSGNDTVLGGGGPDVLSGGAGADFIRGDAGIDRLLFAEAVTVDLAVREINTGEAAGDTILLVEILDGSGFADDLRGDAEANILRGRDGADTLRGRGGDDTLEGGRGADILIGQNGSDSFLFTGPNQGPDTINDFEPGIDRIAVTGAVFGGLAPGALDASRFVTGTATDNPDQLFRYDPAKGRLFYDADGSGAEAARLLAVLAGQPAISASDIEVV